MKYCAHDYQAYATDFVLSHPYCGLILDIAPMPAIFSIDLEAVLLNDKTYRIRLTCSAFRVMNGIPKEKEA